MLDEFDLHLLAAMQGDSQQPVAQLAEEVGLSAPACYRRLRRLRDTGRIVRETALVDPATMGWAVTMVVLVTLERDRGRIVDDLVASLRAAPEVTDIWYVTGGHDLVLHVAAKDMASYDRFTRRVLHAEEHVRSFTTLVVLDRAKRSGALPPAGNLMPERQ